MEGYLQKLVSKAGGEKHPAMLVPETTGWLYGGSDVSADPFTSISGPEAEHHDADGRDGHQTVHNIYENHTSTHNIRQATIQQHSESSDGPQLIPTSSPAIIYHHKDVHNYDGSDIVYQTERKSEAESDKDNIQKEKPENGLNQALENEVRELEPETWENRMVFSESIIKNAEPIESHSNRKEKTQKETTRQDNNNIMVETDEKERFTLNRTLHRADREPALVDRRRRPDREKQEPVLAPLIKYFRTKDGRETSRSLNRRKHDRSGIMNCEAR